VEECWHAEAESYQVIAREHQELAETLRRCLDEPKAISGRDLTAAIEGASKTRRHAHNRQKDLQRMDRCRKSLAQNDAAVVELTKAQGRRNEYRAEEYKLNCVFTGVKDGHIRKGDSDYKPLDIADRNLRACREKIRGAEENVVKQSEKLGKDDDDFKRIFPDLSKRIEWITEDKRVRVSSETLTSADFNEERYWKQLGSMTIGIKTVKATLKASCEDCVIKIFPKTQTDRFEYENKILGRKELQFPDGPLVPRMSVVNAGHPEFGYLALWYFNGGNLSAWIARNRGVTDPCKRDAVRNRVHDLFKAVRSLHHRHIYHGNLKATTVLLDGDGRLALCAPELPQAAKTAVTAAKMLERDIKSLGVILNALFSQDSDEQWSGLGLLHDIQSENPPSIDEA
jgi:hypothetical protein